MNRLHTRITHWPCLYLLSLIVRHNQLQVNGLRYMHTDWTCLCLHEIYVMWNMWSLRSSGDFLFAVESYTNYSQSFVSPYTCWYTFFSILSKGTPLIPNTQSGRGRNHRFNQEVGEITKLITKTWTGVWSRRVFCPPLFRRPQRTSLLKTWFMQQVKSLISKQKLESKD